MISYNVWQKSLIFQKYKKNSPAKYAKLLYLASSIRWISIMFDFEFGLSPQWLSKNDSFHNLVKKKKQV